MFDRTENVKVWREWVGTCVHVYLLVYGCGGACACVCVLVHCDIRFERAFTENNSLDRGRNS